MITQTLIEMYLRFMLQMSGNCNAPFIEIYRKSFSAQTLSICDDMMMIGDYKGIRRCL